MWMELLVVRHRIEEVVFSEIQQAVEQLLEAAILLSSQAGWLSVY
jgi:hypothetical protein